MMLKRRKPTPIWRLSSTQAPPSSGPRCKSVSAIARISDSFTAPALLASTPAIPHISVLPFGGCAEPGAKTRKRRLHREFELDTASPLHRHPFAKRAVLSQAEDRVDPLLRRGTEVPGDALLDDPAVLSHGRGDHRKARSHVLDQLEPAFTPGPRIVDQRHHPHVEGAELLELGFCRPRHQGQIDSFDAETRVRTDDDDANAGPRQLSQRLANGFEVVLRRRRTNPTERESPMSPNAFRREV